MKRVEAQALVAEILGVTDSSTFTARWDQLARMRLFGWEKSGRGRRPSYGPQDVLQMVIAFDLISIGILPDGLLKLCGAGLWESVERCRLTDAPLAVSIGGLKAYGGSDAFVRAGQNLYQGPSALVYPGDRWRSILADTA